MTRPRPNVISTVVPRPRVEGVFATALESSPLVVLKAPIGSGKSTLLAAVVGGRDDAVIFEAQPWHRGNFAEDLIAAMRAVRPDFGRRIIGNDTHDDALALAQLFVADLRHVHAPLVLAIDNAEHFAEDRYFATFFESVANAAPADVRLVISGRTLPPVALTSLLLRRRGASIPPELLSFTDDEIASALRAGGQAADTQTVERVARETGGWAASIALALRDGTNSAPTTTRELALQFLDESFLRTLDDTTQEFFELISVFDKLDETVLRSVAEYGDVTSMLDRFEATGAPFTREGTVYRAHPIARELGVARLKASGREAYAHALAARAYASRGKISAALFHLAASGDEATIDRFFRDHGASAVRTGNHSAIASALQALKRSESQDVVAYVSALLAKDVASGEIDGPLKAASQSTDATIAFSARAALVERAIGRTGGADESALADLRERAEALDARARAKAGVLHGWWHAVRFDFSSALESIAPLRASADDETRFDTSILAAYAHTASGDAGAALRELDELVRHFENDDRVVFQTLALVWQARLAMLLGRTTIASDAGRAALRLIEGLPLQAEHAALYLALAEIATHEGDAVDALRFAELTRTSASRAWYSADVQRAQFMAELTVSRAAFLGGDVASALDAVRRIAQKRNYHDVARAVAASESAFYASLLQRDARETAESVSVLLANAEPRDAADAVALSTAFRLLEFLDSAHQWQLPLHGAQLSPFTELIAARQGVVSPRHLAVASPAVLESALTSITRDGIRFETRLIRAYAATGAPIEAPRAKEPTHFNLTPREREIVELLVEGLSNKEIAQRLVLSPRTVETHVERVLGKLEVGSRSRAIAKALRVGLVTFQE